MTSLKACITPSDRWIELKSQMDEMEKTTFHQLVCDAICEHCLDRSYADSVRHYLLTAMPLLEDRLLSTAPSKRNFKIAKEVAAEVGYDISEWKPSSQQRLAFEMALVVLLYFLQPLISKLKIQFYETSSNFLRSYGKFSEFEVDEREATKLFHFANIIKCSTALMKGHREHHIVLVTKICEGKFVKFSRGGGQTLATTRRQMIYHQETGTTCKRQEKAPKTDRGSVDTKSAIKVEDAKSAGSTSFSEEVEGVKSADVKASFEGEGKDDEPEVRDDETLEDDLLKFLEELALFDD